MNKPHRFSKPVRFAELSVMRYEPLQADRYYHVYNRGNNKQHIFFETKNYFHFLNLIKKYLIEVCDIYAYCLIKNHFHLLVKTKENIPDKIISQAFSNCFNAYSKAINKSYNRTGSLFQDRFKRKMISEESYLRSLIMYIHLNPEMHNIIEDFTKYNFSSFNSLISEKQTLLNRQAVLDIFGDGVNFKLLHLERNFEIEQLNSDLYFD